jgi:hypothetical protein
VTMAAERIRDGGRMSIIRQRPILTTLCTLVIGSALCVMRYPVPQGTVVGMPLPVYALEPVGDGEVFFFSALTPLSVIGNFALAYGLVRLIRRASQKSGLQ